VIGRDIAEPADMISDQAMGAIPLLSGLTDVDPVFAEIARWLRRQPGIRRSSHSIHMSRRRADSVRKSGPPTLEDSLCD
jgi:hypothetical protein